MKREKFLITTAIAYTSKIPHIGNTYDWVLADVFARFKRLQGYDVFFLTGTDEHGQKIQEQAEQEGITPKEHVDGISRCGRFTICSISATTGLFARPMKTISILFKRYLRNYTIRAIFIRGSMKVCIVHRANHFLRIYRLPTAFARTVDGL